MKTAARANTPNMGFATNATPTIAPSVAPNVKLIFALEASLLLDAPAK